MNQGAESIIILIDQPLESGQLSRLQSIAPNACVCVTENEEERRRFAAEAEVIFGDFGPELLAAARRLRWLQTRAAGVDAILTPEFVERDVILTSAKGTVGVHLAEQAMALLLSLTRGVARAVREIPRWDNRMAIRHDAWELLGKTMGIVGFGGTGREVASRAAAFGMRIIAVDPENVSRPDHVEWIKTMDGFHDLLVESDVVCLCCPLTPDTCGLLGVQQFATMKNTALLINVTRGKIVDDAALVKALRTGQIGGAGLDTPPIEPLLSNHPLWSMPNVVITPHVAGGSPVRDQRAFELFCENLRRFVNGEELLSVIDKRKGY